jgi:hypothetical protein
MEGRCRRPARGGRAAGIGRLEFDRDGVGVSLCVQMDPHTLALVVEVVGQFTVAKRYPLDAVGIGFD